MNFLKVSEAATQLRVSVPTVYRIIYDGHLPSFRIRNVIRIRQEDLNKYMEELMA